MSITDELRGWMDRTTARFDGRRYLLGTDEELTAIADRIDAEYQITEDEWRAKNGDMWLKGYSVCHEELMEGHPVIAADLEKAGWVKLPVDADGVPIRVGDVMDGTCPSGKHVNGTVSAIGDGVFWLSNVQFSLKPDYMHHYHAPTVEDVLREFGRGWHEQMNGPETFDISDYVERYAAKLRLAGDAE